MDTCTRCDLPSSLLQPCLVCAAVRWCRLLQWLLHASYLISAPAVTGAQTSRRAAADVIFRAQTVMVMALQHPE